MSLSLILPCYNPPEGWAARVVAQYQQLQALSRVPTELILVLDGCEIEDAIRSSLKNQIPGMKIIHYTENRGKGYAIRQGVSAATGHTIIYTDIDFPYHMDSMLAVYNALTSGETQVAIGVKNDDYYSHVPAVRRFISKSLRRFIRFFLSIPITDTQCGLKGFTSDIKPLFLKTTIDRYLFDLEFVRSCFRQEPKVSIQAIPVQLNAGVHFRRMNFRILIPEMINFMKITLK